MQTIQRLLPTEGWRILFLTTGCLASVSAILGWVFGFDHAVRVVSSYPAMVPSTATCFLLLCIAALIQFTRSQGNIAFLPLLAIIFLVTANGLLEASGIPGGVDALVAGPLREGDGMSNGTGLMMLLATAILLVRFHWPFIALGCALLGFSISIAAVLANPLYLGGFIEFFRSMSLPTAGLFALVFSALIFLPDLPSGRE
jgi:hypothetical protein